MIPEAAVEAAWDNLLERGRTGAIYYDELRAALEAAAPHMSGAADLMRWKLDALKEWSDAMINESNSPQYGIDVKTLLDVESLEEARDVDAP